MTLTGVVNSKRQAIVDVNFYNAKGEVVTLPALVDTGFDCAVAMPAVYIKSLGLEKLPYDAEEVELANGDKVTANLYFTTLQKIR